MTMEQLQGLKVVSIGGLNSNVNHLQLSDQEPGSSVNLLNFEASLYGGYRRLSGFTPLIDEEIVDEAGAEGRILLTAIYGSEIIVARKQQGSDTYEFYKRGVSSWTKMMTGLTRSSLNVSRIRYRVYNFNGVESIIFVDGVNNACIYNGTDWTEIKSTNTGASFADAGGNQAIDAPNYVEIYKNHIFLAQDNLVVHSAPLKDYDFTVASGAGQIPSGYLVTQIKTFRDWVVVFGIKNIKKVEVNNNAFVLNEITSDIGCLAPDSVIEMGGNLVFLSQDGFRPISGTNRIGDTEIETISKRIQQLITKEINTNDMYELNSVQIRGKSQVRFFFSDPNKTDPETYGIIGCLRNDVNEGVVWEWSQLLGINSSCSTSSFIGSQEYVIHGGYNGGVYRQEQGNSFNGNPVQAVYQSPYLDFGDSGIRKTIKSLKLFLRPEGPTNITMRLTFDWDTAKVHNPEAYAIDLSAGNSLYGTAVYGTDVYAEPPTPVINIGCEGSGFSIQTTFSTVNDDAPYTIQGMIFEFSNDGRK